MVNIKNRDLPQHLPQRVQPDGVRELPAEALISSNGLAKAQKERGRFRDFLRTSLRNHVYDGHRRRKSAKRGGDQVHVPLPGDDPDSDAPVMVATGSTPDRDYDREWALDLLKRAMDRLESEYQTKERAHIFEALHPHLVERMPGVSHSEAAIALGMKEGAVKTEVSRMRARYRDYIDQEIAATLSNPTLAEIESEKQTLLAALSAT
jgi:DNA-directed RNA polymerase specialized sigma24 family protein